jgi:hypothetical protein
MKLRLLALAALATVGTAPAHAAATSSASFTDITFELIDLNPADMLAPTITFVTDPGAASYVHAEVSVFDPDNGTDGANLTKTGVRSTTSKSTNVNYGSALAGASVTGGNTTTLSGEGEYTSVISAMSASGGSGSPSAGGNASYNATAQLPYGWWSQNFFLGNNTALLITANATVSAENTVGFDGVYSESAYSSLSLSISGAGPTGSGSQSFSDGISTGIWGWAGTDTQNRTMAAAFLNTSGGDLFGTLSMQASVSGSSSVVSTPVPEPETYAMMLAGLGALGFIGRRRKQQK